MVGVVSYGSAVTGASYNYLIGASVVQDDLRQKHIQPRESATTRFFDLGLNDLHRQYFKRALSELQRVKKLDPGHPTVAAFIVQAEDAIQQGKDRTTLLDGTPLLLAVLGAGVLVLVMVVATTVVVLLVRSPAPTSLAG